MNIKIFLLVLAITIIGVLFTFLPELKDIDALWVNIVIGELPIVTVICCGLNLFLAKKFEIPFWLILITIALLVYVIVMPFISLMSDVESGNDTVIRAPGAVTNFTE